MYLRLSPFQIQVTILMKTGRLQEERVTQPRLVNGKRAKENSKLLTVWVIYLALLVDTR